MSTGKTLSKGTLGLRFMQNAQRAKQQAAVEFDRAKVKDDAEWEVSKEVREAWGLASRSKPQTEQTIAHESSYLPFLFPSLQDTGSSSDGSAAVLDTSSSISGRRRFSKGREVLSSPSSVDGPGDAQIKQESDAAAESSTKPSSEQPKDRRNLGTGPLAKKRGHKLAELDRAGVLPTGESLRSDVPVLSMISEETSAVVGLDMRQMRKPKAKGTIPAVTDDQGIPSAPNPENKIGRGPLSFLRPAGVDSPASSSHSGKKNRKRELDNKTEEDASLVPLQKKASSECVATPETPGSHSTKKIKKQKRAESGHSTAA